MAVAAGVGAGGAAGAERARPTTNPAHPALGRAGHPLRGCPDALYLVVGGKLTRLDPDSQQLTVVKGDLGTRVDALGYAPRAGVFWGVGGGRLMRVDGAGEVTDAGPSPVDATAAAVDGNRLLVLAAPGNRLVSVDIDPTSATFGAKLADVALSRATSGRRGLRVGGLAVSPLDGDLYGVERSPRGAVIVRIDPASGQVANVTTPPMMRAGEYGALTVDATGVLVAVDVASSGRTRVWRVPLDRPQEATSVDAGPARPGAVGAGCVLPADVGDAPDSYRTAPAAGGPYHRLVFGKDGKLALALGERAGADDAFAAAPQISARARTLRVALRNATGAKATLAGWLDADGDGTFAAAERAVATVAPKATAATLSWPRLHVTDPDGASYVRLRLFAGAMPNPLPTGAATGGEVEDHPVSFTHRAAGAARRTAAPQAARRAPPGKVLAQQAGVTVTKTVTAASVTADNHTLVHTITITNGGATAVTGQTLTDDLAGLLDDAVFNDDLQVVSGGGTATYDAPIVTWTGNVPAGGSVVLRYSVTVPCPLTGDQLLTTITTAPGTDCADGCPRTDTYTGLSVVKSSDTTTSGEDGIVHYTLTISNDAAFPAGGVVSIDDLSGVLDDATFLDDAAASTGEVTYERPNLLWTGEVPAHGSATITYSVRVGAADGGDDELYNHGFVYAPGGCEPLPFEHRVRLAYVGVRKTASTGSAAPGETVTYTITLTNRSGSPIVGQSLTDNLAGVLDDATYVAGSATASSGAVPVVSGTTLTWTGDLPVGGTVTITYQVRVNTPPGGNGTLTDSVTAPGTNCPGGSGCVVNTPIGIVTVSKSVSAVTAHPGDTVTYTVTLTNNSDAPVTGQTLTDDLTGVLDDAALVGSPTATSGTASVSGNTLTWTGDIPVGGTVTIVYSVRVDSPPAGDHTLSNVTDSPDTNCPEGPTCTTSTALTDVRVAKTVSPTPAAVGDTVTYEVVLTNHGTATAVGQTLTDDLTDVLDDATFGTASATSGTVSRTGNTLSWTGDIAPGATVRITYTVTVTNAAGGNATLSNGVSAPHTNCPADTANCATTGETTQIRVAKTASVSTAGPSGVVRYTLTVTNTGTGTATNQTLRDDLSGVLDDADYNAGSATASSGTVTVSGDQLSWTGDVPGGETITITYEVTVRSYPATGGDATLTNAVTGPPGSNCPAVAEDCTTTVHLTDVSARKVVDKATANAGDVVTYTVTLTNAGTTTAIDQTYTDDLSGVLDDATFVNVTASWGTATHSGNTLTWTGSIAPGATITITYSVRVNSAPAGDHRLTNGLTGPPGTNCPADATTCTTTTELSAVTITKTADATSADAGDTVTYTLTIANPGTVDATDQTVRDDLAGVLDNATWVGGPGLAGAVFDGSRYLTWTGTVPAGGTVTITYQVRVNDPRTGNDTMTNAISGPPGTNCPSGTGCSTVVHLSRVTVQKTASASQASSGDTVTYTIEVHNGGSGPATGQTITDDLAGVLDDATLSGTPTATWGDVAISDATLTWTGDIPPGSTVTITYTVVVNSPPGGDGSLTNGVAGPGTNCPADAASCSTDVPLSDITVRKSVDRSTADAGDEVTYTITVHNNGPTDAADQTVTDDLSRVLDDATYVSGSASGGGPVTLMGTTLSWTGTVPGNGTVTITYVVRVKEYPQPRGDNVLTNAVTGPPGSGCPAGQTDCDTTTTHVSDVSTVKTADRTDADPGDTITYTIVVRNDGTADAVNQAVTDTISPNATYNNDANPPANLSGSTLMWTLTVPAGGSVTFRYSVTVHTAPTAPRTVVNGVTGPPGTNCPDDATHCSTSTDLSSVSVRKSVAPSTANAGDLLTYTVLVTNDGPGDADDVVISDDLSDALQGAELVSHAGSFDGSTLTWTIAHIPAGGSVELTYTMRVRSEQEGDHNLVNTVTGPPGSTCEQCQVTVPTSDVTVVKTAGATSAVPGDTVTYTIKITNRGTADAVGQSVVDDLSGLLDDATFNNDANASTGTVGFDGRTLTWHGTVPAGGTVTVTYSVTVNDPPSGDLSLTNAVTGPPDTNCPGEAACHTEVPVTAPRVTITKTSAPPTADAGDTVTYTVTITNDGTTDWPGHLTDDLSNVLDDATYTSGSASDGSPVTLTGTTLSWDGVVRAGETVTITYEVKVNPSTERGDNRLVNGVDAPGTNCPGDAAACSTTTELSNVTVKKSAEPATAGIGATVTYTITVANDGTGPVTGQVVRDDLTGVLAYASYNHDANPPASFDGTTLQWSLDIGPGGTVTLTYSVTVTGTAPGGLTNAVDAPGTNCPDAEECHTTTPTGGLSITKARVAPTGDITPGDLVEYRITIDASGIDFPGYTLTDDLSGVLDDADLEGGPVASGGSATVSGTTLTWTGDLAAGTTVTITYRVRVKQPTPPASTADLHLIDRVTGPNSNCLAPPEPAVPECSLDDPVLAPRVEIAKTATGADGNPVTSANPGDQVRYTITVTNTGTAQWTGDVTDDLTDVLDDAVYNHDADHSGTLSGDLLTWTVTVPAAPTTGTPATVELTYSVTVHETGLSGARHLGNRVYGPDGQTNCTVTDPCTTGVDVSNVTLHKTVSSPTANPGDMLTYVVTVTNHGPGEARQLKVTDDIRDVMEGADFIYAGTGGVFDGTNVTWVVDVPASASVDLTYWVVVRPSGQLPADHILHNTVLLPPGATCDEACDVDVALSDVHVSKTPDRYEVRAGEEVEYTITITNGGAADALDQTVTDELWGILDDASFIGGDVSSGQIHSWQPRLDWSGHVRVGDVITIHYRVHVNNPPTGDGVLHNMVWGPPDTNCPWEDPANCQTEVPVRSPRLTVDKRVTDETGHQATSADPGDTLTYTVTVRNDGDAEALDVTLVDDLSQVLDDADYQHDAHASDGSPVHFWDPQLHWTGNIPPFGSVTIKYTVQVRSDNLLDRLLINQIVPPEGASCEPSDCRTEVPISNLRLRKDVFSGDASAEDHVWYHITVFNEGPGAATDQKVSDDVSGVLDDAHYLWGYVEQGGGTLDESGLPHTLTWFGDIPAHSEVRIAFAVMVNLGHRADNRLTDQLTGPPGSTCESLQDCATDTPLSDLTLRKTASAATAAGGDEVTYTITIDNTGPGIAHGRWVDDNLTDIIGDGDATLVDGSLTYDNGNAWISGNWLSWSGDIWPHSSVTIEFTVRVNTPPTGNHQLANAITYAPGTNCSFESPDRSGCDTSTDLATINVSKSVNKTRAAPGDQLIYTITVTNSGTAAATNVHVTDDLRSVLDDANYDTAHASIGPAPTLSGDQITWTGDVPAGQHLIITVYLTINNPASGDGLMNNAVVVPGTPCATGDEPDCTTTTTLGDVTVAKTATVGTGADVARPGDTITYQIVVSNVGSGPVTGQRVDDDLSGLAGDATYQNDARTMPPGTGSLSYVGNVLTWTGDLAAHASVTITYTAVVNSPMTGDRRLTNAVTAPDTNCAAGTADPNCTTVVDTVAVTVSKRANVFSAAPGDTVRYTIEVTNTGTAAATGQTLTDDLSGLIDDATYLNDARATAGTVSYAAPTLTWTGDVPPATTVRITYSVRINLASSGDGALRNAVVAPGTTCTVDTPCGTDTPLSALTVTKDVDHSSAHAGDTVTYTLTVRNAGTVPIENQTITDRLTRVLDDATYNNDHRILQGGGALTYTEPTLTWTGALPVGATVQIRYSVTVNTPPTGDFRLTNAVTVPGSACTPAAPCTTDTPVWAVHVAKTVSARNARAGDLVRYTITLTNPGAAAATDQTMTDDLTGTIDDATYNDDAVASAYDSLTWASPILTWTGTVPAHGSVTITYSVTVNLPPRGDHTLTNVVHEPDTNCPQGPDCSTSTGLAELVLTKTSTPSVALPGGLVTYTMTLTNVGTAPVTGQTITDDLSAVLDDADFVGDATATSGTISFASPHLTWRGTVGVRATVTITFSVRVHATQTGDLMLTNVAWAPGSSCTEDEPCTTETPEALVSLSKQADVQAAGPGDTVTYTVAVTNLGQAPAAGVTFTDDLTGTLDDATFDGNATASVGTVSYTAPVLSWAGDLPAGGTATIRYSVTVGSPPGGDNELRNALVGPDTNCLHADDCAVLTPLAHVTVRKIAALATVSPGQTQRYTTTITNVGRAPIVGQTVIDDLTGVLDAATYNNDATVTGPGTVTVTGATLTWTGDLTAGQTATVHYSVTATRAGNGLLENAITAPGTDCPPATAIAQRQAEPAAVRTRAASQCETVTPVERPTAPATTGPATSAPATTGPAIPAHGPAGPMPTTGSPVGRLTLLSIVALLAGVGVVLFARRRRTNRET